MKTLRIVFMGTPDFAVGILDHLIQKSYTIVGVITAPDKPAGRGRKLQESAIKKYALSKELRVLQPTNLKNESFLETLQTLNANLQIVVAFRMLPKQVWRIPEYGTFNLHASLLPNYRGAAPINWAIINGEEETGVTTFFIDEKIDTGAIIIQEKVKIAATDTAGILHDKLMYLGAKLVIETVSTIEKGSINTKKQENNNTLKLAYKIDKQTCKINWQHSLENIYNHIRGLSPYPTAWTTLINGTEEISMKVYTVRTLKEKHNLTPGTLLLDKRELKVAAEDGFVQLLEIQLAGKRKMQVQDVINGIKLHDGAFLS